MTTQDDAATYQETFSLEEIAELNGGEVVATGISIEEYIHKYAENHCEYVEGVVIRVAPQTLAHDDKYGYIRTLLSAYFELRPIGRVIGHPFVMKLPAFPNRRREPDLMVVLNTNPHEVQEAYLDGAADICIEIVSKESGKRDRGTKFEEYEAGGVAEYWMIDSVRKSYSFYRLNQNGIYVLQDLNEEKEYVTPLLPGLRIHIPTLLMDDLPGAVSVVESVRAMLQGEAG